MITTVKDIAKILKDKGFKEDCDFYFEENGGLREGFHNNSICSGYSVPENEQLVNWIFLKFSMLKEAKEGLEFLSFWYYLLHSNKFTLLNEFIARLNDQFILKGLYFLVSPLGKFWCFTVYNLNKSPSLEFGSYFGNRVDYCSFSEARYYAVVKCFEILLKK